MDDFLHNLRSGKLKQPERPNRPYNDQQYKGGQRRNNMMDRRKREFESKESVDRLSGLKEVLETLADSQKRMANAYEARTVVEDRKARAMEVLAKNIYRMLNPNALDADQLFEPMQQFVEPTPPMVQPQVADPEPVIENLSLSAQVDSSDFDSEAAVKEPEPEIVAEELSAAPTDPIEPEKTDPVQGSKRLSEADRQILFSTIRRMRDNGDNWEHIARHIADQGYPTLSGKGSWRGIMAKTLFEKMAS